MYEEQRRQGQDPGGVLGVHQGKAREWRRTRAVLQGIVGLAVLKLRLVKAVGCRLGLLGP